MVRVKTTIIVDKDRRDEGKRLLKEDGLNVSIFCDQSLKRYIQNKKEDNKNGISKKEKE